MLTATSRPPSANAWDHTTPAIETTDLVVRYGARLAVDGLTLRVPRGSIYGLLGANGAGKTTTIKALLGVHAPAGGSARVLGYDITRQRVEINARIGFVSETNSLYTGMTYQQLCAFFRATGPRWRQEAADRCLATFGLPANVKVRRLSKGMKTQLALCLALGTAPDLLILDEPTTGLDPVARHAFLDTLVRDAAAAGTTVFFSSHILPDVESIADHVGILRSGKLLVSDEVDALKQRHASLRLTYDEPPSAETLASISRIPGVASVAHEGRTVRATVSGPVAAALDALRSLPDAPTSVDTTYLTLDDIFLSYMQGGAR